MWTHNFKPSTSKQTMFFSAYAINACRLLFTLTCLLGVNWNAVGYANITQSVLSIKVIEARVSKETTPKVDKNLLNIKDSLVKSFPKLNHFKYLKSHTIRFVQGKKKTLPVANNLTVKLTPLSNRKKQLTLKMEVPQKKASFKLKAQKGQLFYQAMRWKNKVYILAFKAK